MPDNALEKAENLKFEMAERITALEADLTEARAELARAERFISEYHAFMSGDTPPESLEEESPEVVTPARKRPRNPPKEKVAELSVEIIRERGEPIPRDDLYEALDERGLHIEGKDPRMVLSTMLWRQPETVVRLKRGGYWPANDPLPEGEELAARAASE
ncbi:MAG: hypothetical protein RID15_08325 [Marinovum algicola]|uniref:HTH HARE-type domain-containing protein n=1 Tax=Marinovum algicola TaxID=42444 RepID=A0A975W9U2_9RHOB|nr:MULTISPECIES: hypothetical protein [Marinovum]MDD9739151.1 hypothetical protein [Marinovum sp. SP66]SEJ42121.1 hypothetical protein SAMN04487940_105292 [Marinovum algicola]SLN41608.1 hypothetical protein MAA5396_02039 [Marinovum algicola]